ncbi:hypothetical protein Tco_0897975, partial [Tanacetum coccineum]
KDSPGTKGDWQDDPYHETKELFVELDQAIEDVVAEEIVDMANDQDEELFDQEVADDSLDDEEFHIRGLILEVLYSRFHIQRFRSTHFVSRSFHIKVMNYILQVILNDIYKCVDACKDAQTMWNKIKKIDASQFVPHVKASKAKKSARNHDPLVLVANSDAHSLYSHASSSYSRSPQPYYVTHPSSMIDNDDEY